LQHKAIDVLRLIAALFVLALLDAATTYVIITLGVGAEANPAVAHIVNGNPAAVFPLALISAAVPAVAVCATVELTRRLPAWPRIMAMRLATSALFVMITWRVAAIVNNILVIAAGAAPLADVLSRV
jgi:hypothetical protein